MERNYSKSPLISVIMPAYNAEEYLTEAVESVRAQTYTEWELLILDDGSTDGTAEIALKYAKLDSRISYHPNERNMGVAETRNRGFELAKGEWTAMLDSDDAWHPEKLQKQLRLADDFGADIVYCSYALCGDDVSEFTVPDRVTYESMLRCNHLGCSTVMLRSELCKEFKFRKEFYHEDYALWLELLRSGYKAAGCTEILVNYRVGHESRSKNKINAAKQRWAIYRKAEKLSLFKSARVFLKYAYYGFKKHKRL